MTASEMFNVPIAGMDPLVRRRAKAINFGIIYGISAFGLANQLDISREEAGEYIRTYFKRFPGIRDYIERTKRFCREQGICRDHLRPARAFSADKFLQCLRTRLSGARRHQCADTGLRRRHHPPGDDPHAGRLARHRSCPRACSCRSMTNSCSRWSMPRLQRPWQSPGR